MERPSLDASARFARRVVSVVGFIPNAPTHRRDTIECKLDCGHTRSVVCLNRGEAVTVQTRRLIGSEIECAKCSVLERIRQKARSRRTTSRRVAARSISLGSRVAS
jgi:hypothetical protein